MLLSTLLAGYTDQILDQACHVRSMALNSAAIKKDGLFFAMKGGQRDGRNFIAEAIKNGACAVCVDATLDDKIHFEQGVPVIPIKQLKLQIGNLAARFYQEPGKKLKMIGVTGTSGKTSCTHFIAQILQAAHGHCAMIGTLGHGVYGATIETGYTTPDALTLQHLLRTFVDQGIQQVVMEVSSHGIDQGRINAIPFHTGIFTNLSQDHLDYHGDMASYASVKHRFLAEWVTNELIINADDDYGRRWIHEFAPSRSVIAYSLLPPSSLPHSVHGVFAEKIDYNQAGIKALLNTPWGKIECFLPLIGRFNLSNALATLAALCVNNVAFHDAVALLAQLSPVPGRMQYVKFKDKPTVVVDYAHKPDALEKVLATLREYTRGKLICVFGCGGDRDKGKRPLMAEIAERLADHVIITNDNPRHEEPSVIVDEICKGLKKSQDVDIVFDRAKAIEKGIQLAAQEDCVLVAGKGAECYQQFGDKKYPFSDLEQVKLLLSNSSA